MESFGSVEGLAEGIRVNRLEDRLEPLIPFPHKHDFYQILLVKNGSGNHEIDFHRYEIPKQKIFVMRPAEVHTWTFGEKKPEGLVLEFNRSSLASKDPRWQSLRSMLDRCPSAPKLHQTNFKQLYQILESSLRETTQAESYYELLVLADLLRFLVLLSRAVADQIPPLIHEGEVAEDFMELIEKHFRKEHSVSYYAKALGLTPKALTMRLSRLGQKTPSEMIQDRCLLEAKRLLAYSQLSIQIIAESIGWEDPNYFSRFFKHRTGMSPGEFRKQSGNLC